ncbi:pentatricopeptide repeat-containing protein [Pyrus ussuriensis x Pyrus communis]|uniref:Pentatricopeptide repeat-containing protein n=1 Tax=Pyrus ussuriensis x Pyrus communis TaxID=2448454 RepID=A0A5N5I6S5_9ROSA|nr:pentatricopeptide repeat-containing protein [Pyrus ussuriensis x Pyrus communis]
MLDLKNDLEYNSNSNSDSSSTSSTSSSYTISDSETHLALGVFDFPWLKDGVISKPEDLNFEDVFSSPLACIYHHHQTDRPDALLLDFPKDKLEEDLERLRDLNQGGGLQTEAGVVASSKKIMNCLSICYN